MYESAREKLKELLRQETEIKEQISHWGPVVEQLARLSGETVDAGRIARNAKSAKDCQDLNQRLSRELTRMNTNQKTNSPQISQMSADQKQSLYRRGHRGYTSSK